MKQELVSKWTSPNPVTLDLKASLDQAQSLLKKYKIRRLPVIDKKKRLVGIVTLGDVREASPSDATSLSVWEINYLVSQLKVSQIMTRSPMTVNVHDTIAKAAELMLTNHISGLPVLENDGRLVGIITESDIFRLIVQTWYQADEPDVGILESHLLS